jgi:hypothetical protein
VKGETMLNLLVLAMMHFTSSNRFVHARTFREIILGHEKMASESLAIPE